MKTVFVPLIGDPFENLYQLGLKERESFIRLEKRVTNLLSANNFLRYGQDIISRARSILKKKENTFFNHCITAYSEGLGIDPTVYLSFISLFELAAHYGQIYPELKGLLPGCCSLFEKNNDEYTHSRLIDFPLIGIFDSAPRLYYWKIEGKPAILNYSCEGLAPLFFQTVHDAGFSMALHHKPGENFHKDGHSIFKIAFESLFEATSMSDFRKDLKTKLSMTKWGFLLLEQTGNVVCIDLDGPALNQASYSLNENPSLIFTNIPLQREPYGHEHFFTFCLKREQWLKDKLARKKNMHTLDAMTDVNDQKIKKWTHPTSTLSTVGAFQVNLSKGLVQVKEGDGALVASDALIEFSLSNEGQSRILKNSEDLSPMEKAWKEASRAQSSYDQGLWELAYHHLQMAQALMPHPNWKQILGLYLHVWDFKFVGSKRELAIIYREVKKLQPPEEVKDQWLFLCMRLEKKLSLAFTVDESQISIPLRKYFQQEKEASLPVFMAWMKLLYPRLEILDIFSPHHR